MNIIFEGDKAGLGDGIVGCASAFILSKALKANFFVNNSRINFYNYFDVPKEYTTNMKCDSILDLTFTNNIINLLTNNNLADIFSNKTILLKCNQNLYQFIYKNPLYSSILDIEETNVIKYLFDNILIIKKSYVDKFNYYNCLYDIQNSLTIHIRCDNVWSDSNTNDKRFNTNKTVNNFIKCIQDIKKDEKIILTTDNLPCVSHIFKEHNISFITIDGDINHSFKENNIDYAKTLIDLMIINYGKKSIISYWSNFSRISCFMHQNEFYLVKPFFTTQKEELFDFNLDKNNHFEIYRKGNLNELLSKEKAFV